jgi:hypothetical protein
MKAAQFIHRTLLYIFAILSVLGCSTSKQGKIIQGKDGKIEKATILAKCTPPQKTYGKELEAKLKTEVDSLRFTPHASFEASFAQKIIKLHEYSSEGLDWDLVAFRICELANNRGFTSEQTSALMQKAMELWEKSHTNETPKQVAISYNQQGGITANNVYVNSNKANFPPGNQKQLLSMLPNKHYKIEVNAIMGNSISLDLAKQISAFLKQSGYKTDGYVGQFMRSPEIYGVLVDTAGGKYKIDVGYLNN